MGAMARPNRPVDVDAAVNELLIATGQLFRRLRAESNVHGLTWSQASVLARLDGLGPMTTADLARVESVKPQSMGATLAALETAGFVERRAHPTDGRQLLLVLTERGVQIRRENRLMKQEWLVTAMSGLSPEEQHVLVQAAPVLLRLAQS
jgi:DNA-binding MarR family transcriptional regulator